MNDANPPLLPDPAQPDNQDHELRGQDFTCSANTPASFEACAPGGGRMIGSPMSFSQILDRIVRLMRTHLRPFVGIAALPVAVFFACYLVIFGTIALTGGFSNDPKFNSGMIALIFFPAMFFFLPVMMVAYSVYCAAASHAAIQADLGVTITVREAFARAWEKPGRYVWLMFLRSVYISLPMLVAAVVVLAGVAAVQAAGGSANSSLGLFLLVPFGILAYFGSLAYAVFMSLRLSLAIPASVVEKLTAAESLRRSAQLTKGAKGRIFLVLLIVYAATYIAFMVFFAVLCGLGAVGVGVGAAFGVHLTSPLGWVGIGVLVLLAAAGIFLFLAVTYASYAAAFAVLYHDQRRRKPECPPDGDLPAHEPAPLL